mgnify:FL=1
MRTLILIVVKLVDVFHKYMYVSHFCLKHFAAIEIQKDTIVINYAEPLGSGAEGEVCRAMWYKKDVAVKLFKGCLTI